MTSAARQTGVQQLARSDVEQIVREVIARFAARSPSSIESGSAVGVAPNRLSIDDRVVTVATLTNRLHGVNEVEFTPGAVVTPAAQDLLREKHIRIGRRDRANASFGGTRQLIVAVAATSYEPVSLLSALKRRSIVVEQVARVGVVGVIDSLCERIALGGERGLLLTGELEVAVCLANRHRGVRAVACGCYPSAKRAMRKVAANMLIVDPRGKSSHQLERIAEALCSGEYLCPSEYAGRLGGR